MLFNTEMNCGMSLTLTMNEVKCAYKIRMFDSAPRKHYQIGKKLTCEKCTPENGVSVPSLLTFLHSANAVPCLFIQEKVEADASAGNNSASLLLKRVSISRDMVSHSDRMRVLFALVLEYRVRAFEHLAELFQFDGDMTLFCGPSHNLFLHVFCAAIPRKRGHSVHTVVLN